MQVVTESEVVEQSTRFEQAMIGGDPTALLGLCDAKAEGLPGEEGETWAFLRVHFQQDPRRSAALSVPSMQALSSLGGTGSSRLVLMRRLCVS